MKRNQILGLAFFTMNSYRLDNDMKFL